MLCLVSVAVLIKKVMSFLVVFVVIVVVVVGGGLVVVGSGLAISTALNGCEFCRYPG